MLLCTVSSKGIKKIQGREMESEKGGTGYGVRDKTGREDGAPRKAQSGEGVGGKELILGC